MASGPNDTYFDSSNRCRTVSVLLLNNSNTRVTWVDVKFRLQEANWDGWSYNPNGPKHDDGPYRATISIPAGEGRRADLFVCPSTVTDGPSQRFYCTGGCAFVSAWKWEGQ